MGFGISPRLKHSCPCVDMPGARYVAAGIKPGQLWEEPDLCLVLMSIAGITRLAADRIPARKPRIQALQPAGAGFDVTLPPTWQSDLDPGF